MKWRGGGFAQDCITGLKSDEYMNPFNSEIPVRDLENYYTELLPDKTMQWAMKTVESPDPTRGNLSIANQNDRPDWLLRQEYYTFAALRAYPMLQLRKLVNVVKEKSLPLKDPNTKILIEQALYHIGTIVNESDGAVPCWKKDLLYGEFLQTVHEALTVYITELEQKERDHDAFPIIISIISYCSHWQHLVTDFSFSSLRQRCTDIAYNRAETMVTSIVDEIDEKQKRCLVTDQCKLYMYAMLPYSGSFDLDINDIGHLIKLNVLVCRGLAYKEFADDTSKCIFASIEMKVKQVMNSRASLILDTMRNNINDDKLTNAVRSVFQQMHDNITLSWNQIGQSTDCFETVSPQPDVHLFSINVLTGVVLMDGNPPGSLPSSITSHPKYKRSFNDRNFEVVLSKDGVFETITPLQGFLFKFFLENNNLHVWEIENEAREHILELMNSLDGFPIAFKENYSYWLCRSKDIVMLRLIVFSKRQVFHIILLTKSPMDLFKDIVISDISDDKSVTCQSFRVPLHLQNEEWPSLLDKARNRTLYDCLLRHNEASGITTTIINMLSYYYYYYHHY
jgi:hypothetical protein